MRNLILNTDSYKQSHFLQTAPGVKYVSSYIEARGAENPKIKETAFFGIHMACKDLFSKPITLEDIDEAQVIVEAHGLPFNREGWLRILNIHGGYVPIKVEGVPEGSVIPLSTPLVQIVNTDPELPWVTSYFETAILRAVWYATTVATKSREIKKVLKRGMMETAGHCDGLDFMLHDFGCRGASSYESSSIGGLAHLINFKGTDTLPAIVAARRYYKESMAGFSVPASEHSTITSWGMQNELLAFENMMDKFSEDDTILSCVSDSYHIYDACKEYWGGILKDRVIEFGTRGGKTVVRPDSGPLLKSLGTQAEVDLKAQYNLKSDSVPIQCVEILMQSFGYTTNKLGYKVLPKYIGVLQGDGWKSEQDFEDFIKLLKTHKISMENFVFGMGGGLLQSVTRDTFKFAMKASAVEDDKGWRSVFKNPYHKGKKSKKGVFKSVNTNGEYSVGEDDLVSGNLLTTFYENGKVNAPDKFDQIRLRAEV